MQGVFHYGTEGEDFDKCCTQAHDGFRECCITPQKRTIRGAQSVISLRRKGPVERDDSRQSKRSIMFVNRYARYTSNKPANQPTNKQTCPLNAPRCRTEEPTPSSPTITPRPLLPFHHTFQLLTQRIPHPPLPGPLTTHPFHATGSRDHEPHSPQRWSLLLRPPNLTTQAICKT